MNKQEKLYHGLIKAVKTDDLINIKLLVQQGADIHLQANSSLRYSAGYGNLEQGADIHAEKDEALRWSVSNGHFEVVKYLIEHGADIHINNDYTLKMSAKYDKLDNKKSNLKV
jgi:ankyrin repeat protein